MYAGLTWRSGGRGTQSRGRVPRRGTAGQWRRKRQPSTWIESRQPCVARGSGSGSGDQYAADGCGFDRLFQGEIPKSRLQARCALSGLAANSSITAASIASWRFCARSASRSSRQRWQRKSPSSLFRYAQRRQPPCAVSAFLRRRQLRARLWRHPRHDLAYSPFFLTSTGFLQPFWTQRGRSWLKDSGCGTSAGRVPRNWASM